MSSSNVNANKSILPSEQKLMLRCSTQSNSIDHSKKQLWFELEEGKKASFVLVKDSSVAHNTIHIDQHLLEMDLKPAVILIDCCTTSFESCDPLPFLFGGIDMTSNARTVEVYVTDEQGKETYVTTSKGMKVPDRNNVFSIIMAKSGGPQRVISVKLKLLSLPKPNKTVETQEFHGYTKKNKPKETLDSLSVELPEDPAKIYSLKIKGRIFMDLPSKDQQQESGHQYSNGPQHQQLPNIDINSIAMTMTLITKSMEGKLLQAMNSLSNRMSAIENQVQNLQQQSSYQMQLLQAQNMYLARELSDMKKSLGSVICNPIDANNFETSAGADMSNESEQEEKKASSVDVDQTVPQFHAVPQEVQSINGSLAEDEDARSCRELECVAELQADQIEINKGDELIHNEFEKLNTAPGGEKPEAIVAEKEETTKSFTLEDVAELQEIADTFHTIFIDNENDLPNKAGRDKEKPENTAVFADKEETTNGASLEGVRTSHTIRPIETSKGEESTYYEDELSDGTSHEKHSDNNTLAA